MKIPIKLNGENIVLDVPSGRMLLDVLRERGLVLAKCGCTSLVHRTRSGKKQGHGYGARQICGACTVLLDGVPVPSCIVPVAIARDSEVITLEYFAKTPAYSDIIRGFKIAGVELCGFCNAGKIFAAEYLLRTKTKKALVLPSLKTIYEGISFLSPCCTSMKQLSEGIIHAFNNRVDREGVGDRRRSAHIN